MEIGETRIQKKKQLISFFYRLFGFSLGFHPSFTGFCCFGLGFTGFYFLNYLCSSGLFFFAFSLGMNGFVRASSLASL